jgi:hypothetical protein
MLGENTKPAMSLRELLPKLGDLLELPVNPTILAVGARDSDLGRARFFEKATSFDGVNGIPRLDELFEHCIQIGPRVGHGLGDGVRRLCGFAP